MEKWDGKGGDRYDDRENTQTRDARK